MRAPRFTGRSTEDSCRWKDACGVFRRAGLLFVGLPALLLFVCPIPVPAEDVAPVRRGGYAVVIAPAEILDATGAPSRTCAEGEVFRVRKITGALAEVASGRPELTGGQIPVASLRPGTSEENTLWVARGAREAGLVDLQVGGLKVEPSAKEEIALETAEAAVDSSPPSPLRQPDSTAPGKFLKPIIGWLNLGKETKVNGLAQGADGTIFLTGSVVEPSAATGSRDWGGGIRDGSEAGAAHSFLARLAPDIKLFQDFVVFAPDVLSGIKEPCVDRLGGIWVAAEKVSGELAGPESANAGSFLVCFAPDLRSVRRGMPLLQPVLRFAMDSRSRPVVLSGTTGQSGGGFLARYFSEGRFERKWLEAPDGATRRLKLDFSSPALAGGPFALWAKKSEAYPDFPTPIAPWGAAPNAGQPVAWTNVKSGQNPIRKADLKPEALVIDHDDNILVAGTIPFHMGQPDFDPFLMRFSPKGKLLWTNCLLNGLLSEPDQKTQALAIDPSNGDIIVSFWQHGNNQQTLLLDPAGWLIQFTGTSGNIKLSWIGRVDAATGRLKNSTYLHAQMPESPNKNWPNLNSTGIFAMKVDGDGRVHVGGETAISLPTTDNAFLPVVSEYGIHPMFAVLKPDLSGPVYSTYLSAGIGSVQHLALLPGAVLLLGRHSTEGTPLPVTDPESASFLSAHPPENSNDGIFFAILPVPDEETSWNFQH